MRHSYCCMVVVPSCLMLKSVTSLRPAFTSLPWHQSLPSQRVVSSYPKVAVALQHRWCKPRAAPSFSAHKNMAADEFGDDDFLADFDLDQAVAQATPSTIFNTTATTVDSPSKFATFVANDLKLNSVKRRKFVSLTSISGFSTTSLGSTCDSAPVDEASLTKTLQDYFGYPAFRPGQFPVIEAVLQGRDAAVFWATGSGKSLNYQIPALHTDTVAIVVSPLISLMQDQTHKLNFLSASSASGTQKPVATFLGSAQTDPDEEPKALRGEYNLIYVTPEKLVTSEFLQALEKLHKDYKPIRLIAIDESHCVSEWGHDFRPSFRSVGPSLRTHDVLRQIPLLALTATAVPRVQEDILTSLQMENPLVVRQSFDRTNLEIIVKPKSTGGTGSIPSAFQSLLAEWQSLSTSSSSSNRVALQSTIVYAPTRSQVDNIASYLQTHAPSNVRIEAYHAGMNAEDRTTAHRNFLTGVTTVIVATVAFGMGIDKPDTRRVIHFGPPKTLEEYYQQIGRAGRDGLPATCILYVASSDLDRYQSDFYLGGLHGKAKEATLESMEAMKRFSLDAETCRRKQLLLYFNEEPAFGDRCGTCDVCKSVEKYGDDAQRDFGGEARIVLHAVDALNQQSMSQILLLLADGATLETHRYKRNRSPSSVKATLDSLKSELVTKRPAALYRELIPLLAQKKYIVGISKTVDTNGFKRTYTVFEETTLGRSVRESLGPVQLPVPESIREQEQKNEEKRKRVRKQLEDNGVRVDKLPQREVEEGDGEVIRAYSSWYTYLERLRHNERHDRVEELESLLGAIEKWRLETAVYYQTSPSAVLAEHVMIFIAYTAATCQPGIKMDNSSLVAAGVRARSLDQLVSVLGEWADRVQPKALAVSVDSAKMVFEGGIFTPTAPWQYAVYKPNKKTGLASWESSYNRFVEGESPQAIALLPVSGKSVQVQTVIGHIMEGLMQGRGVDLQRIACILPPPTQHEWQQLQEAERSQDMDPVGDPNSSGPGGEKFTMTAFLRPIIGEGLTNTPYSERSEEERKKFSCWCDLLKWYLLFRRTGYTPSFSPLQE